MFFRDHSGHFLTCYFPNWPAEGAQEFFSHLEEAFTASFEKCIPEGIAMVYD